ncbi:alpha/beta hydrolase [Lysinibacter cavernae]|uniref:Alpha/beta hydrolase n=1 Tax=Lysinibacter cavernae TaxID=1640652 RepID=A0A7X5R3U5_9MICO|nr:alpha/beta hydrolase [Lysinibacter cavernae]NIH54830.1 hypothetical protein [Lysinibacter cavernae]
MSLGSQLRAIARHLPLTLADFGYATLRQLATFLLPKNPNSYRSGDQSKPLIVLVPGVYETWRMMQPIAKDLHAAGYRISTVTGLGINRRPIAAGADLLAAHLDAVGGTPIILVAHSKGGLMSKRVLAAGSHPNVLGAICVATPFAGSEYARFVRTPAVREFLPDNPTLLDLTKEVTANTKITSIVPSLDPNIPSTAALDGAKNIVVPARGHFLVLRHGATLIAVRSAVDALAATAL